MNTFLTSTDRDLYTATKITASELDDKRCFKQIVEGMQLLLLNCKVREPNNPLWAMDPFNSFALCTWTKLPIMYSHPAYKMWQHSPYALDLYIMIMADEWTKRGGETSSYEQREMLAQYIDYEVSMPSWWGSRFHDMFVEDCHRNLIRKNDKIYRYTDSNGKILTPKDGYIFPHDTKSN